MREALKAQINIKKLLIEKYQRNHDDYIDKASSLSYYDAKRDYYLFMANRELSEINNQKIKLLLLEAEYNSLKESYVSARRIYNGRTAVEWRMQDG